MGGSMYSLLVYDRLQEWIRVMDPDSVSGGLPVLPLCPV